MNSLSHAIPLALGENEMVAGGRKSKVRILCPVLLLVWVGRAREGTGLPAAAVRDEELQVKLILGGGKADLVTMTYPF